ncbi:MAG: MBL fold metallo-hydrolase [Oscillospiraceae bacterium]|jgi:phosphoribosyl 1,2-cyclic phosphodiesterase|nr:MBL fold metallo-hydrolase [Oscillospiraceae bacterium]
MALIIPLCSSSSGNSVFIGSRSAGILIDAGCSFRKLRLLLDSCEIGIEAVKAVLVTHEHSDHIKGLFQLTKHTEIPVYASGGTLSALMTENAVYSGANLYGLSELKNAPTDFEIKAFSTPHDSAESVGFTLEKNDLKIAYCTDLGIITSEVRENIIGSDFVFLESNYEPELLRRNRNYPAFLKRRITSDIGHLPNGDCAEFLIELVKNGATRFILGHLSRENNTPALAYESAVHYLAQSGAKHNRDYTLEIAPAETEGRVVAV